MGTDSPVSPPRIGGHVSLGPKPEVTLDTLVTLGFGGLQIHASSPRTWHMPSRAEEVWKGLGEHCAGRDLHLFLHAVYLINLASSDDRTYNSSIGSLCWLMRTASALSARAVVVHVGSHGGRGLPSVRARIADALTAVLAESPAGPSLLLENSAGGGGNIGTSFGELHTIIQDVGSPSTLGVCLDTAHAHAVGHDFKNPEAVEALIEEIDGTVGIDRLRLMHVNDSKAELGTGRDRHDNIGAGQIGREGFTNLFRYEPLRLLPLILETPNPALRPTDLEVLRSCLSAENANEMSQ
jgi:deoxyribonuclease-4